jgi:hypothetical protein
LKEGVAVSFEEEVSPEIRSAFDDLFSALFDKDHDAQVKALKVLVIEPERPKKKAKKTGFDAMKMSDLKSLCKTHGLKVGGSKADLIGRLSDLGIKPESRDQ